jgi:hypothetical protein
MISTRGNLATAIFAVWEPESETGREAADSDRRGAARFRLPYLSNIALAADASAAAKSLIKVLFRILIPVALNRFKAFE